MKNLFRLAQTGKIHQILIIDKKECLKIKINFQKFQEEARPYCTLCEYAIGEMDKLITDKKNMYQIKAALDRICYELSTPIQKQCLKMVDDYTDEIIQMFVNEYTPQQVCYEIGLCDPPTIEMEEIITNVIPRNIEREEIDLQ